MRIPIFALALSLALVFCNRPAAISETEDAGSSYDSVLAAGLGADDYGMKTYIFAYLKAGPNRDHDSATIASINRGHLDNIIRLAEEGKLVLAGPFLDSGEIRGIFVFDVPTAEEAEALINTDPAIRSGRLAMDLRPWYGPAALLQINEISKKIAKKSI